MNRFQGAALFSVVLVVVALCDGGSRGSGVTTVEGNVANVQTALRPSSPVTASTAIARLKAFIAPEGTARAQAEIEGIQVSIDGTPLTTFTDSNGFFTLGGRFESDVIIRFQHMADGSPATIPVNVPAAGTLTLSDVTIDEHNGQATAQRQNVDFEALLVDADCSAGTLGVVSSHRSATDTDVYTVRLDSSSLHDSQGAEVSCEELRRGDTLRIRGIVHADGAFAEADIILER